jgi:folate-binding protein YgfZ
MSQGFYAVLPDRALLRVGGPEARAFLQGLVSNDVEKVSPSQAVYAALLTPQGKFLHDFFVYEKDRILLLDVEAGRRDDLAKRLKLFRLRAKVTIEAADDLAVVAVWGPGAENAGVADPRLAEAGARLVLPKGEVPASVTPATPADYDAHRLALGLPDGSRDMEVEKSVLLECGFEELHGVDFDKGCYMGQELTARTKYRGLVKRRLMPVAIEGAAPAPGTQITLDGRDAGEMRSGLGSAGIALIRLDALEKARVEGRPLMAGDTPLAAWTPSWMSLPADE